MAALMKTKFPGLVKVELQNPEGGVEETYVTEDKYKMWLQMTPGITPMPQAITIPQAITMPHFPRQDVVACRFCRSPIQEFVTRPDNENGNAGRPYLRCVECNA